MRGLVLVASFTAALSFGANDGWQRHEAPWAGRDGAGLLALGGELYLLGGWLYGPVSSEVWRTRDLVTWERLPDAPWPGRHGSAWLVHDSRLWVIGGDLYTDVWSSPDGIAWTQETATAPFGPRYTPNAVSLDGRIIVYAGQSWVEDGTAQANSDVWASDDGRSWTRIAQAPWQGRGLIHGSIVHDGEAWLVGGGLKEVLPDPVRAETAVEFSDIWSSPDGRTWTLRGSIPFAPRTHSSVVETPLGCVVSDGSAGTQANLSADLYLAPDCLSYERVPTPYGVRHASSVAWFRGALVVLGGPDDRAGTDVWEWRP